MDGAVGVKYIYRAGGPWTGSGAADVGTGDSYLSYQVYGTVAYRIGWASIAAGYRYMSLDYSTDNYKLDMSLKGPMIRLTVHF